MPKKINHVAIVSSSYSSSGEGSAAAGSFVHDFAIELSKLTTVTILAPDTLRSEDYINNIRIIKFEVPKIPLSVLRINKPLHWYFIIKTLYSGSIELKNLIGKESIDHIFALWTIPCGFWAFRALKNYGIQYSCWSLGSDIWSFKNNIIGKYILNKILTHARVNYADGYLLANDVEKLSGIECKFLPSTRNLPKIPLIENTHNGAKLLFLGRWHLNKGIDLLLESLHLLENDAWDGINEIIIAGGGELETIVMENYTALKNKNRPIKILGYQNANEAAKLIANADYLLIPSRFESIPVIFSDALQLNTPLIATPVGDFPTLFSNYNLGILCSSTTPQSISFAIKTAIKTPPLHFSNDIARARKLFNIKSSVQVFYEDLLA